MAGSKKEGSHRSRCGGARGARRRRRARRNDAGKPSGSEPRHSGRGVGASTCTGKNLAKSGKDRAKSGKSQAKSGKIGQMNLASGSGVSVQVLAAGPQSRLRPSLRLGSFLTRNKTFVFRRWQKSYRWTKNSAANIACLDARPTLTGGWVPPDDFAPPPPVPSLSALAQ